MNLRLQLLIRTIIALCIVAVWCIWTFHAESIDFWPSGIANETDVPTPAVAEQHPANPLLALRPMTVVVRAMQHLTDPTRFEELATRFAKRGVKRVWLQIKQDETDEVTGGLTFFPNDIAPLAPGFEDDRFGKFVDVMTAHQIDVFAWQPMFHDPTAIKLHPEWRAHRIDSNGAAQPQDAFVCPARPDAVRYQAAISCAVLKRYAALKGLYLDFIRFDDDHSCACESCMAAFAKHLKRGHVSTIEIRDAGLTYNDMWTEWVEERARRICKVVEITRDTVDEVRPRCWIGASVLPFSFNDYFKNTQSGQDFYEMAREGLDEIVVMGYWDDWDHSPSWLGNGLQRAMELTRGECHLSCLLDGDMNVRKTRLTLQALGKFQGDIGFFLYGQWNDHRFNVLDRAVDGYLKEGDLPRPAIFDVVIRIDTEPDSEGRYDTVNDQMIRDLTDLFQKHDVKATFVTCGKLAELQPDGIREAQQLGHEIACHAYNHEQLDEFSPEEEVRIIDHGLRALKQNGLQIVGFGAPRNSISQAGVNYLIDAKLEYDGSAAYDPFVALQPVDLISHEQHSARIVQVPFVIPNDYDARFEQRLSASGMLEAWKARFVRVMELGEPCFVLDIHQWISSHPDNLRALAAFIRYVKRNPTCRIVTLRTAAANAKALLERYELAESAPFPTRPDRLRNP
jgi:peptidoglycan/xylan/chitin deacetylase (PgdA/CDA1 family)